MQRKIARLRRWARIAVLALSVTAVIAALLAADLARETLRASALERRTEAATAADVRIIVAATGLLQAVTDVESSQRSYLLSPRRALFESYVSDRAQAGAALAQLATAGGADPAIPRLGALARQRLDLLGADLRLATRAGGDARSAALDQGRRSMSELRSQVQGLLERVAMRETKLRAERRSVIRRSERLQTAQAAATVLALLIALVALVVERLSARLTAALHADLASDLEAARGAAEAADRAKSRFLAAASHDMRQPLHALALYISALEHRLEGGQALEILGHMDGAVRAMTRLFTALLDMARLEAGVLRPDRIDFAIEDLLQEVAEHSLDLRGRRDVKIRVAPTTLKVRSDPDLLEIALRNLASNAVKHSQGGRVLLGCRRVDGAVRIEVRDDGKGIAAQELSHLFGEFVRGDGASGTQGVGLGLAIVDRLTKLLGHPLTVRSEVGRGSVFSITVPRSSAATPGPPAPVKGAPLTLLNNARIMIADDEPLALDAMRRTFVDVGAKVFCAASSDAVEALSAQDFDLYVLDLNFGDSDGLELIDDLERRGGMAPALIVTGTTMPDALARLRRSGRPWVTKPLAPAELLVTAASLIARPCGEEAPAY